MRRATDIVFWLALAAPAAVTLALVLRYGVNVPYADQWTNVTMLARFETGTFAWADLFNQHNEHRIAVPRLIMLGLARLTHWNIRAELVANVALAAATLLVLVALAWPLLREASILARLWAAFAFSALLFSLSQWENWLWGFQITWMLHNLGAVLAIALATWSLEARRSGLLIAGAAAAATVAQYSLASGIILWPLLAVILAFHPRRLLVLPLWIGVAAIVSGVYLRGYVRPSHHPSPLLIVEQPGEFLVYLGNYLSGPIGRHALIGLAAVLAFVVIGVLAARRHRHTPQRVLPWIGLGGFALGNAALTGIGRLGLGAAQGLDSRYSTIAVLLPIATIALALLALRDARPTLRRAAAIGALALTGLVIHGDSLGFAEFPRVSQRLHAGLACLLAVDTTATDQCLTILYPQPFVVRMLVPQMATIGWSGFGPPHARRTRSLRISDAAGEREWRVLGNDGTFGIFDAARLEGDMLLISGWAVHPRRRQQPRNRVLVVSGNTLVGEAETINERPDVAGYLKDPSLATSGWALRREGFRPDGPLLLRAYLVIEDGVLAPLMGEGRIP